jgi:DNA repair protein RadC
MDEAAFEKKLNELVKEIGSIPAPQRNRLIMLAKQTHDCHKRLKKSVDSLQESLDYLRVSIKYMLFDLEATRRENAYLRKLLEDSSNR